VYVTGIGRVKLCKQCGMPEGQCRCQRERTAEVRPGVPRDGIVRVALDRKGRGGKAVTLVMGVPGEPAEVMSLGQSLKKLCGAGGAIKDDVIEVQGDHRDRIVARLMELGYKVKRAGG
jgi:translation initiation factor 1